MTATTEARTWWSTQPEPVRAILDLADDANAERIARTICPQHAAEIVNLGDDLRWVERLRTDEPADVLADFRGFRIATLYADEAAETAADELQADVLVRAQLIASLITGGAK